MTMTSMSMSYAIDAEEAATPAACHAEFNFRNQDEKSDNRHQCVVLLLFHWQNIRSKV